MSHSIIESKINAACSYIMLVVWFWFLQVIGINFSKVDDSLMLGLYASISFLIYASFSPLLRYVCRFFFRGAIDAFRKKPPMYEHLIIPKCPIVPMFAGFFIVVTFFSYFTNITIFLPFSFKKNYHPEIQLVHQASLLIMLLMLFFGALYKVIEEHSLFSTLFMKIIWLVIPYIFIGLFFSSLYAIINHENQAAFKGEFKGVGDYIYFSFTTLTTLGYGDYSPVHIKAKILAIAEAVIGVFYASVIIGVVLSEFLQGRRSVTNREGGQR